MCILKVLTNKTELNWVPVFHRARHTSQCLWLCCGRPAAGTCTSGLEELEPASGLQLVDLNKHTQSHVLTAYTLIKHSQIWTQSTLPLWLTLDCSQRGRRFGERCGLFVPVGIEACVVFWSLGQARTIGLFRFFRAEILFTVGLLLTPQLILEVAELLRLQLHLSQLCHALFLFLQQRQPL